MKKFTFTSFLVLILCLGASYSVSAQVIIEVDPGVGTIREALSYANAGDIIELSYGGSEGIYIDTARFDTYIDITIRAAEGLEDDKPIIDCSGSSFCRPSAGLNLYGIKFTNFGYCLTVKAPAAEDITSSDFSIRIDNCDFYDYGNGSIYYNSDATGSAVDSVIIRNTTISNGADRWAIYTKKTKTSAFHGFNNLIVDNVIITGVPKGAINVGLAYDTTLTLPNVFINHVTVNDCGQGIQVDVPGSVTQNCVLSNTPTNTLTFESDIMANPMVVSNMMYTGEADFVGSKSVADTMNIDSVDAQYVDVIKGNFTLVAGTAGTGAATDGTDLGYIGSTSIKVKPTAPVVTDPSFEIPVLGLTGSWEAEGWGNVELNTDLNYVHNGLKSLKFTSEGGGGPRQVITEGFSDNSEVTLMAWVKTKEAFIKMPTIVIQGYNSDDQRLVDVEENGAETLHTDRWTLIRATATLPVGVVTIKCGAYVSGSAGVTYFDDFEFVVGKDSAVYKEQFTIAITAVGSGEPETGTISEDVGSTKLITAEPADGWEFDSWSGDVTGTDPQGIFVMDDNKTVTATFTEIGTALEEFDSSDNVLNVYPNPTTGTFYVSINEDAFASSIQILDITGKVISRMHNLNGQRKVEIDLSSVPAGIYFGKVSTETDMQTFKIIKK